MTYTVKKLKDELQEIPAQNRLIDIYTKRLDRYKLRMNKGVSAVSFDTIKTSPTNNTSDPTGDSATSVKLFELEDEINKNIDELVDNKLYWAKWFKKLLSEQRVVLELRYFEGMDWADVACESHYSKAKVHEIHGQALVDLVEILDREGA